jgi:hypothetical protein
MNIGLRHGTMAPDNSYFGDACSWLHGVNGHSKRGFFNRSSPRSTISVSQGLSGRMIRDYTSFGKYQLSQRG